MAGTLVLNISWQLLYITILMLFYPFAYIQKETSQLSTWSSRGTRPFADHSECQQQQANSNRTNKLANNIILANHLSWSASGMLYFVILKLYEINLFRCYRILNSYQIIKLILSSKRYAMHCYNQFYTAKTVESVLHILSKTEMNVNTNKAKTTKEMKLFYAFCPTF